MSVVPGMSDQLLLDIGIILVSMAVLWVGCETLEAQTQHLSSHYELPPVVRGSVLLAIGSSFPELATVLVAGLGDVFELGVGAIVGSAMFNLLVIPAVSGLKTGGSLESSRSVVYKEALFYVIALLALVLAFALGVIYFPESGGKPLDGQLTRGLAAGLLLLYTVYLFFQVQDSAGHEHELATSGTGFWRSWAKLGAALLVITIGVHQLVGVVESFDRFGVPHFLGGVLIVAAATSLPDAFVSIQAAKQNDGIASLGNVLGSNTIDLLVAIPVGVLIVGGATVNLATALPIVGALFGATLLFLVFARTGFRVTTSEAATMLVAYFAFFTWVLAETFHLTNVIGPV
jgi:cation:H+ antiporter